MSLFWSPRFYKALGSCFFLSDFFNKKGIQKVHSVIKAITKLYKSKKCFFINNFGTRHIINIELGLSLQESLSTRSNTVF